MRLTSWFGVCAKLCFYAQCFCLLALKVWVEHASEVPRIHSVAATKIGKRIRDVRQHLGISLEDLGDLSEVSWTTIGKIERGAQSPNAKTLVRLATALEVDAGQFLRGLTADDYGNRVHQVTARDLIRARTADRRA